MSPEAALLVAAVRAHAGASDDELHAAVARVGDWALVLRLAAAHGVLPLTTAVLLERLPPRLPPGVGDDLRRRAHEHARRALALVSELHVLRRALSAAGLRVLAFKGPALAVQTYGQVNLRPSRDLDLLVEAGALAGAHAVVTGLGYGLADPVSALAGARLRHYLTSTHQAEYVNLERVMRIDVQTAVVPPFFRTPPFDELWGRREIVRVPGGEVDALGSSDLLPALCLHGLRHGWERLIWIADVALLTSSGRGDGVVAAETRWRARAATALGLELASLTTGAPPLGPAAGNRPGGGVRVARLARLASDALFSSPSLRARAAINFRLQWLAHDGWRERARYLRVLATTPSDADWAAWQGRRSRTTMVLLRPLRLAMAYGASGARGGSRDSSSRQT